MKNLDQVRAKHALEATAAHLSTKITRADVAGFPALIIQNGLLAAFAYASEEGKEPRKGLKFACDKAAEHLGSHGIKSITGCKTARSLIEALSSSSASPLDLQRATAEALVFFGFLKRFAPKSA